MFSLPLSFVFGGKWIIYPDSCLRNFRRVALEAKYFSLSIKCGSLWNFLIENGAPDNLKNV